MLVGGGAGQLGTGGAPFANAYLADVHATNVGLAGGKVTNVFATNLGSFAAPGTKLYSQEVSVFDEIVMQSAATVFGNLTPSSVNGGKLGDDAGNGVGWKTLRIGATGDPSTAASAVRMTTTQQGVYFDMSGTSGSRYMVFDGNVDVSPAPASESTSTGPIYENLTIGATQCFVRVNVRRNSGTMGVGYIRIFQGS